MARKKWVAIVAVPLVLAIVAGLIFVRANRDSPKAAPTQETATPAATVQSSFQPVTGIRTTAPTAISGALSNNTNSAVPVTIALSGIPSGASVQSILPNQANPNNGNYWACTNLTCTLTAASGGAASLAPNDTAQVMVLLTTAASVSTAATLGIAVNENSVDQIPLALADAQTSLADNAITARFSGPSVLLNGSSSTTQFTVTNLATSSATNVFANLSASGFNNVTVSASGTGWSCNGLLCSYQSALEPFSITSPLQLTTTSPSGLQTASGSLSANVTSSISGTPSSASTSFPIEQRPSDTKAVSTRLSFSPASTLAPGTTTAVVTITPTGNNSTVGSVSFSLSLPSGISADWDSFTTTDPFSCSSAEATCSSTSPLPSGVVNVVEVPLNVAATAHLGTSTIDVITTVNGATSEPTTVSAGLVVAPPPVAEFRASLTAPNNPSPDGRFLGQSLSFSPGQPRELAITLTNNGSVTAPVGAKLFVSAIPDSPQKLTSVGGEGWRCNVSQTATLSPKKPLRCSQTLTSAVDPDTAISLPFTLQGTTIGDSSWTIGTGASAKETEQFTSFARVDVVPDAPLLVADLVQGTSLYDGGSGRVDVMVRNAGSQVANGGIVVISVPADADVTNIDSGPWTCLSIVPNGANGTLTCATTNVTAGQTSARLISLQIAPRNRPKSLTFSAWATTVGQYSLGSSGRTATKSFEVAGSLLVDAGQNLTVVTPQTSTNGSSIPAVVVLNGDANMAASKQLRWDQLCTQPNEPGCGATTSPKISWLGVAAGKVPTTLSAKFTAPAITAPTDLFFQLSATVGTELITDTVTVRLVPPTTPTNSGSASNPSGDSTPAANAAGTTPTTPTTPVATPVAAFIANSQSVLQIPTVAAGQLFGTGNGSGNLTYSWTQTSGPSASILGTSATQATLQFETPLLAPNEDDEMLTFELTVTDSTGASATASAQVQVVWGDNGLQVTLNNGAKNVTSSIDSPVVINSQVTSRGAPYTYAWTATDLTLPTSTATNLSSISFTTGDAPANGSAQLQVTDSFGRVTTSSIPVIISALPPGQLPQAFCNALPLLRNNQPAQLSGQGVNVTINAATLSPPAGSCGASTTATISSGSATLPGGVSLSNITGQLTVAGVTVTSANISVPTAWSLGTVVIGNAGLLIPFVSSTSVGTPLGTITSSSVPVIQLEGWSGTTSIQFESAPSPLAVLTAQGSGPTATAVLQMTGTSSATSLQLSLAAKGLVTVASIDLPVSGSISVTNDSAPVFNTVAAISSPATLRASTTLTAANLNWSPTSTTGSLQLQIGTLPGAISLTAQASVTSNQTALTFTPSGSQWIPATGVSPLTFSGTGSISSNALALDLSSTSVASLPVSPELSLQNLSGKLTANCPLDGSQNCAPSLALSATATSPLFSNSTPVNGVFSTGTMTATLAGSVTSLSLPPLSIGNVQLSVVLGSSQNPSATGTGSTSILGSTRNASIDFTQSATIATSQIGTQSISTAWQITDAIAIATTAQFTFTPPTGPLAGEVSVPIPTQQLTGVGITQFPSSLADGVLPAGLSTALASFPITGNPATIQLVAPAPSGWYLGSNADSSLAFEMDTIGFVVTPAGENLTVSVTGTATLTSASITANGSTTSQQFVITSGNLTEGPDGGVLSATFAPASPSTTAFGVNGLATSQLTIAVSVTSASTVVTLNGSTTLPAAFSSSLGIPSGATPTISASLSNENACISIDLASGGGDGVDFGGAGFLIASSAYLVIAPAACTTTGGASVPQGMSLIVDGSFLDVTQPNAPVSVSLTVDPTTFSISDTIDDVSIVFGGCSLSNTTISVTTNSGSAQITVSGESSINNVTAQFSGTVTPSTQQPTSVGILTLSASLPSLSLDGLTISGATASISGPSVLNADSAQILLTGSASILGTTTPLKMIGDATNGIIETLSQTLPRTTFTLPVGSASDSLAATFDITYSASPSPAINITANDGLLKTPTQEFDNAVLSVDGAMSSLSVSALVPYINDNADGRIKVSGAYSLGSSNPGAYEFSNATTADGFISGIPQKVTATFSRATTGASPVETGTQTSNIALGVLDSNTDIELTGPLSTTTSIRKQTLTSGEVPKVSFRGLTGTMNITVNDSPTGAALPYTVSAVYTTSASSCDLWSAPPVLTGDFYRNSTTTYFTLSGQATPILPFGFDIATVSVAQPVVLSNEYLPGSVQSPNAISLTLPFTSGIAKGSGTISFGLADCSYSITASVTVIITGGAAAQELASALQSPSGLSENVGALFGGNGELPPNIMQARQVYAYEARQHQIQRRATDAAATQTAAQTRAQDLQNQLMNANDQRSAAERSVATANENYRQAVADQANAQDKADNESILPFAGQELADAYQELNAATTQVNEAEAAVTRANANLNDRTIDSNRLGNDLTAANEELENRTDAATAAQEQEQGSNSSKLLQLTFLATYCETCAEKFTASINGEFYFDVIYVVGIQLGFNIGDNGYTVDIGGNFGIEWQHSYGTSDVGIFLDASLTLSVSTEYSFSSGWEEADFSLQAIAQADVYLSTWFATWTADLASIDLLGELFVEPSPGVSGSYDVQALGFTFSGQWGGNLSA